MMLMMTILIRKLTWNNVMERGIHSSSFAVVDATRNEFRAPKTRAPFRVQRSMFS
jgi:hypothetical protein